MRLILEVLRYSSIFQATGGQDNLLRVWILKSAYAFFEDMRQKYSEGEVYNYNNNNDNNKDNNNDGDNNVTLI